MKNLLKIFSIAFCVILFGIVFAGCSLTNDNPNPDNTTPPVESGEPQLPLASFSANYVNPTYTTDNDTGLIISGTAPSAVVSITFSTDFQVNNETVDLDMRAKLFSNSSTERGAAAAALGQRIFIRFLDSNGYLKDGDSTIVIDPSTVWANSTFIAKQGTTVINYTIPLNYSFDGEYFPTAPFEPFQVLDDNGYPIQEVDGDGNPVVDENNNPVYVTEQKRVAKLPAKTAYAELWMIIVDKNGNANVVVLTYKLSV